MGAASPILREQLRERLLQPDVISGSEMLLRSLLLEGAECVFGYPGGSVLYIYDAIYDFDGLRHLLARHEQGAIHAADGYARASGKTGVCIATSGPGATNLITGLAMAFKDNIPLVVITGNVPLVSRGTDAFQEADVIGMTLPITKHSYYITDVEHIPATVQAAFQIASTGRKGPVLIDIPKDISSHKKAFSFRRHQGLTPYVHSKFPDELQIDAVLREIASASKPLILCGEGVDQASASVELLDFAVKANIPVVLTPRSVCAFPKQHPMVLGVSSKQGDPRIRMALGACDLLIVVGSRLDYRIHGELKQLPADTRIVHMDDDEDSKYELLIHAGCYGDPAKLLGVVTKRVTAVAEDWISQLSVTQYDGGALANSLDIPRGNGGLTIAEALNIIADSISSDVIVTVDEAVYHARIVDCFHFAVPRSLVCPIGMEAPGYSLPAAIGAQMAYPERTVISINGEGGIQKCTQELAVCAIHNIALKIVVFSDRDPLKNNSPDFMKMAEAYGLKGLKAERIEEAREVWTKAMSEKGPILVEFTIERASNGSDVDKYDTV